MKKLLNSDLFLYIIMGLGFILFIAAIAAGNVLVHEKVFHQPAKCAFVKCVVVLK